MPSIIRTVKREILAFPSFVNWSIRLPSHLLTLSGFKDELYRDSAHKPHNQHIPASPGLAKYLSYQPAHLDEELREEESINLSREEGSRRSERVARLGSFNMLACELSGSRESNLLESINVGFDYLCNNALDTHLGLTGGQLFVLSGGAGVYSVEKGLFDAVK